MAYVLHPYSNNESSYTLLKNDFIAMLKQKFTIYSTIATTMYLCSPNNTQTVIEMVKEGFGQICSNTHHSGSALEVDICLIREDVLSNINFQPKHLFSDGNIKRWPSLNRDCRTWPEHAS